MLMFGESDDEGIFNELEFISRAQVQLKRCVYIYRESCREFH